jgi:hypothetical protein
MTTTTPQDGMDSLQEILHPGSRALFRYWEGIRGEQAVPSRRAIDLRSISPYVSTLFIIERLGPRRTLTWRLAGSSIGDLFKRELTGSPVFKDWPQFERETSAKLLDGVIDTHQPCSIRFRLITPEGQRIGTEMIAMPILSSESAAVHIFGSLMTFSDIPGAGYSRVSKIELSSAKVIWTVPVPGDHVAAGLRLPRTQPQLTLIDGGRRSHN